MSLILKGIDMPKEGVWYNIVIISNGKGFVDIVSKDNALTKTEPTEAVEIPTPHGRLIDANKIFTYSHWEEQAVNEAPTILEAEEN